MGEYHKPYFGKRRQPLRLSGSGFSPYFETLREPVTAFPAMRSATSTTSARRPHEFLS